MGTKFLARAAAALGVSAVLALGFAGTASASEATAESVRPAAAAQSVPTNAAVRLPSHALAVATVDSGTRAIGVTIPHGITVGMWAAVESGTLDVFCGSIPHDGYRWACQQVADYAKAVFDDLGEPEDDECLRVETRIGWPPIHILYVKC